MFNQPRMQGLLSNFQRNMSNPNTLAQLGIGLMSGQNTQDQLVRGFGGAAMGAQQGREDMREQNEKRMQANMTAKWLQSQGADPTLVEMAQNGMGGQAYQMFNASRQQVKKPTSIQEYEFAKQQGYNGSFVDFQTGQRKAGATNVTVGGGRYGTIPQGYQLLESEEGARMEPIPGGPAALEQQKLADTQQAAQTSRERYGNVVLDDIGRAKRTITEGGALNGTGMPSLLTRNIPGTDGYQVAQYLETIKANAGFDRLQAMRDASPTGGALGQVSERELSFLQAAIGNLEQAQSQEELMYNLERVERIYSEIIHGPNGSPQVQQPSQPSQMNRTSSGIQWSIE